MMPLDGATPLRDASGLRLRGICTREQLIGVESLNIGRAVGKYHRAKLTRRTARFDVPWCLRLHKQMFGRVWRWAGVPRTHDNLNLGIRYVMIQEHLQLLMGDLNAWPGYGMPFIEQGARLHYRAVQIHPFQDGNGRWSRLLANVWLWLHRQPHVTWPEELGRTSPLRGEYLAAVKAADDGDYDPLIGLHQRYTAV